MHLTTLVSLLAVGAAAAPAAKSLDLNTRMAKPTLSSLALPSNTNGLGDLKAPEVTNLFRRQEEETPTESSSAPASSSASSSESLIPELPTLPLRARQAPASTGTPSFESFAAQQNKTTAPKAEKDPLLDAYLDTFTSDGDYDEDAQDKALNHYNSSFDEDKSNSTTTTVTTSTSVAPAAATSASENLTSTTLDAEVNSTSSAVPAPTKAASSDPMARLMGALPVKRQNENKNNYISGMDMPAKRQLDELTETVPETNKEDITTPDVAEQNVTTPAVPVTGEEDVATTTSGTKNATSSAASDGFHGINKHMSKLGMLPVGGLPIKRQFEDLTGSTPDVKEEGLATPEIAPEDRTFPETQQLNTTTPTVDEKHLDAHATAVNATAASASSTAAAGFHGINKHMAKLHKLPFGGLPVKRSEPEVASPLPTEPESPLYKHLVPLNTRDTISKTTDEVAPDTDAVETPEAAVPETGLEGALAGLA